MTEGTSTAPLASHRVDPRVTRTRAALIRALTALVSESPKGEAISMSAVAQRAGLSRQALHNHYSNVGDLATDVWISRLLEDWLPLDEGAANLAQALTDAVRERGIEPLLTAGRADREFFDKLRAIPRGERVAEVLAAAMTTWLTESDRDGPPTGDRTHRRRADLHDRRHGRARVDVADGRRAAEHRPAGRDAPVVRGRGCRGCRTAERRSANTRRSRR